MFMDAMILVAWSARAADPEPKPLEDVVCLMFDLIALDLAAADSIGRPDAGMSSLTLTGCFVVSC